MDINDLYGGQVKTIPEAVISFIAEFIGEHIPVIFEYTVATIARDYESKYVTTLKLIMKDNKDFMKFREIRFPDTLSSLYRNTPGWQSIQTMDFTWIDRNESETLAKITNGLLDNRSIINFDEETDDDGSDMVVNITYDGRRSI